jgi:cysteinyl-tRNA synthetase
VKDFYIYDSHLKQKVKFEPEFAGEARIYLCGPTVYDDAHLGHARSAISFDLLRRVLTYLGYKVKFARNITDIDDKILNKMSQTGKNLTEITEFYADRYHADLAALGVLPPDAEPKATEHIPQICDLISRLVKRNAVYQTANGDLYFSVADYREYGDLSGETQDEMQSRIAESELKRDNRDFAVWKAAKENEAVGFDSPFGRGRPGWHIECSAMAQTHLWREGAKFACDLHAGGNDLFFPHHENEAAQTRQGYGNDLAKYWAHNGFVRIDGQKMSKSLGNSFFVKDALEVFSGETLRFYLMSIHYRAGLNYNYADLGASKKRLDRVYRLKKRLTDGGFPSEFAADKNFENEVAKSMRDDLNISKTLAAIDEMIGVANDRLDKNPKDKDLKKKIAGNLYLIQRILGIGGGDPYEYFQFGASDEEKQAIEKLIAERAEAKKAKNYARADEIRNYLLEGGVSLMDLPNKTVWEKAL